MTRTVMDMEDELAKIWGLVGELSEQLAANRALVTQLKTRSENVKGQATHVGCGFPLRRFNLDISDEEFSSELENFASHLVTENQQLQNENKQLNALLKEYEQTLETVMGKFRGVSHASQQHDLSLHSYYTSLLQTLQTAHSSAQLHDNTSLSMLLHRLSTLLRSALRESAGEDAEIDLIAELPGLLASSSLSSVNGHAHSVGGSGGSGSNPSSSPPLSPARSASSGQKSHFSRKGGSNGFTSGTSRGKKKVNGDIGASGGYYGTEGQADWALDRETEIERLRDENESLREMLRIAQELNELPLPGVEEAEEILTGDEGSEKKDESEQGDDDELGPTGRRRRKSSLTVKELEEGAKKEEEERQRRLSDPPQSAFMTISEGQGNGSVLGITADQRPVNTPAGNTGLAEHKLSPPLSPRRSDLSPRQQVGVKPGQMDASQPIPHQSIGSVQDAVLDHKMEAMEIDGSGAKETDGEDGQVVWLDVEDSGRPLVSDGGEQGALGFQSGTELTRQPGRTADADEGWDT